MANDGNAQTRETNESKQGLQAPSDAWSYVTERALIARIIASRSFARSERLSALLSYLATMSLKGRGRELSEQRIGQTVFGRKPSYDASADGIVRTQVSRLRRRLEQYYATEGHQEPLRVQIPRGSYLVVFERVVEDVLPVPPASQTAPVATESILLSIKQHRLSMTHLPWYLVALLTIALLVSILNRSLNSAPHPIAATLASSDPLERAFWSQILHSGTETLVVPADSGLMLYYRFHPEPISLDAYLMGQYRTPEASGPNSMLNLLHAKLPVMLANRRYTSIVDLELSSALAARAALQRVPFSIRYARDLRPNDLKQGNIVLIGAAEANPWVQIFESSMNFVLLNDRADQTFSVLNRNPQPGEPRSWNAVATDPDHHVFGVIALRSNLGGNGNVLIVEGTSMAGTEAAWDFLTDKTLFRQFLQKIQQSNGAIPHFEVLVESVNTSSSSGTDHIVAWRAE